MIKKQTSTDITRDFEVSVNAEQLAKQGHKPARRNIHIALLVVH